MEIYEVTHMSKPDILLFMSDQHGGMYTSIDQEPIIETPELQRIANQGVAFRNAYTASPLCVPARSSFLTAQLPYKTAIFDNKGALPEDKATFLHSLAINGYETVLCGRMHFLGHNQRHGFTKRLIGDFTITNWGEKTQFLEEQKEYQKTLSHIGCTRVVGGGDSPVLEYDRAVLKKAIEYLEEDHDKPQCIVVGTYAPHFSYVAPESFYEKYKKEISLPQSKITGVNYEHPLQHVTKKELENQHIKDIRAAYFGMISNMDQQIGKLFDAFENYKHKFNKKGVFIYTSDHGDQIGERDIYGKMTHYEGATKIPLIFQGDNVPKGVQIQSPVSLMDIGVTLIDWTNSTPIPNTDGQSLYHQITENKNEPNRHVITEFVRLIQGEVAVSRSIRKGNYKLICYANHPELDQLFDVSQDRYECNNIIRTNPLVYSELKSFIEQDWNIEKIRAEYREKAQNHRVINQFGDVTSVGVTERRPIPEHATQLPKVR